MFSIFSPLLHIFRQGTSLWIIRCKFNSQRWIIIWKITIINHGPWVNEKKGFRFERPGHIAKCLHATVHGPVLEENNGNSEENGVFFLHFWWKHEPKVEILEGLFIDLVFFVHLFWILGNFLAIEFTTYDSKWCALSKYM